MTLLVGALLLDLNLLDGHIRIHSRRLLDGFRQGFVVVDGVPVALYRDLLLHSRLQHAVLLRLVLRAAAALKKNETGFNDKRNSH